MKVRKAYGAIGMLLTLLIVALLFILFIPSLKKVPSSSGINSPAELQSVEERAYDKINEIERLRQQAADEYEKNSQEF